MPDATPILGWEIPLLTDADPDVSDMVQWAIAADSYTCPRFATATDRNTAYATAGAVSVRGQLSYISAINSFERHIGSAEAPTWNNIVGIRSLVTTDITVPGTSQVTILSAVLEADQYYSLRGLLLYQSTTDEPNFIWTFSTTPDFDDWRPLHDDNSVWTMTGAVSPTAFDTNQRGEFILGGSLQTGGATTTATLKAFKTADAGADMTVLVGTHVEFWKG